MERIEKGKLCLGLIGVHNVSVATIDTCNWPTPPPMNGLSMSVPIECKPVWQIDFFFVVFFQTKIDHILEYF